MVTFSPFTRNCPDAPASPPKMPSGATCRRLVTAFSCQGRSVSTVNSTVCPSPPRCRPGPLESSRSSLRRNLSGAEVSTTSTGTAATPVGYEHADSPGLACLPPTPPA